jgi:hypothetical protein
MSLEYLCWRFVSMPVHGDEATCTMYAKSRPTMTLPLRAVSCWVHCVTAEFEGSPLDAKRHPTNSDACNQFNEISGFEGGLAVGRDFTRLTSRSVS